MLTFLLNVLTILLMLATTFYFYAKYKLSYWSRRGVKTPPTHIIFGNFKDTITLKKPPGQVLQDIYSYADPDDEFIGFYIFHQPKLLIRSGDLIKQIMVKDFEIFPNRSFGGEGETDSVGLVNLLGIRQPKWKYLRTKVTPSLTGRKLKQMIPLVIDCGKALTEFIESRHSGEDEWKKLELKDVSSRYTTDVIASLAFGVTTNSFDKNDMAFWEAGQRVVSGVKRGIILLIYFFTPGIIKYLHPIAKKPAQFFREVFQDSLTTREKVGNQRGDFVDSLLALKNGPQDKLYKFDGDNLLAQAVAFYIAGFEASSTAIAFTLYELAQHNNYQLQLYQEISTVLENDQISMDSINSMKLLDDIVNEALRLYPPLPFVERIPIEDYQLPRTNIVLEKGTPVFVSTNGINRDPRFFFNPEEFVPSRTLDEVRNAVGSLTFGVGPRSCIGQRLGLLIAKLAIITVLQKYTISCRKDEETLLNPITIFTNAVDGVYVYFKKRT